MSQLEWKICWSSKRFNIVLNSAAVLCEEKNESLGWPQQPLLQSNTWRKVAEDVTKTPNSYGSRSYVAAYVSGFIILLFIIISSSTAAKYGNSEEKNESLGHKYLAIIYYYYLLLLFIIIIYYYYLLLLLN